MYDSVLCSESGYGASPCKGFWRSSKSSSRNTDDKYMCKETMQTTKTACVILQYRINSPLI